MEFTKITNNEPVVIPATEEKVFDKYWISKMQIVSDGGKTDVYATLIPFNETETLPEPKKEVVIEDIFGEMQNPERPDAYRTLLAQTMELILQTAKARLDLDDEETE